MVEVLAEKAMAAGEPSTNEKKDRAVELVVSTVERPMAERGAEASISASLIKTTIKRIEPGLASPSTTTVRLARYWTRRTRPATLWWNEKRGAGSLLVSLCKDLKFGRRAKPLGFRSGFCTHSVRRAVSAERTMAMTSSGKRVIFATEFRLSEPFSSYFPRRRSPPSFPYNVRTVCCPVLRSPIRHPARRASPDAWSVAGV